MTMELGSEIDLRRLEDFHVLVVGAGVTGTAIADFVATRAASVVLLDEKAEGALRDLPQDIDLAIVSPGWHPDHPIIAELKSRGIPTFSEIDFAWQMKQMIAPLQRWIALTGTNGKTTTIQMVESIMRSAGVSGVACGNVGRTVIESLDPEIEVLAIELSSFQIHWSQQARFEAIALLNISPDHIDWHGSFDSYREAKLKLVAMSERALINIGDATLSRAWPELVSSHSSQLIPFHLGSPAAGEIGLVEDLIVDRALVSDSNQAEVLVELESLPSRAPHNVSNALAAAALAKIVGINPEAISQGLHSFVLDHHRLERVAEVKDVLWIDDSKATNPHAAMAALLAHTSVIWVAGGLAKGASMDELVRATSSRIRAAILIGTDAPLIRRALLDARPELKIVDVAADGLNGREIMRKVVTVAKNLASRGDTVLLAPACASMDQFTSYAERGRLFQEMVHEIVSNESRGA